MCKCEQRLPWRDVPWCAGMPRRTAESRASPFRLCAQDNVGTVAGTVPTRCSPSIRLRAAVDAGERPRATCARNRGLDFEPSTAVAEQVGLGDGAAARAGACDRHPRHPTTAHRRLPEQLAIQVLDTDLPAGLLDPNRRGQRTVAACESGVPVVAVATVPAVVVATEVVAAVARPVAVTTPAAEVAALQLPDAGEVRSPATIPAGLCRRYRSARQAHHEHQAGGQLAHHRMFHLLLLLYGHGPRPGHFVHGSACTRFDEAACVRTVAGRRK